MANASTPTLLPLDQYAAILGIDPRHFNQVYTADFPVQGACDSVWFQYAWQDPDKASREDLARAIAQAERLIAHYIGFWPAPTWISGEIQRYPFQPRVSDGMMGTFYSPALSQTRRKTLQTNWRYYSDGGRRRVDLIELNATVNYLGGQAVIGVTDVDVVEEYEVAVFSSTDTAPENRIRNLTVTLGAAGAITIVGEPSQFIDPQLWEDALPEEAIDGDVPGNYLVTVDVYRVYTSDETNAFAPVEFAWQRPNIIPLELVRGVLQLWSPELGLVSPIPAAWDTTDEEWDVVYWGCLEDEPHFARLWYYCGWPSDTQGHMQEPFARAVAALATALLMKPICGCNYSERLAGYWQERPGTDELVSFGRLDCPWGTQNGAWEAYRVCQEYMAVEGISAT